ncbi:hypothetical protein M514_10678 [Trichuris suis]|uniref:Uncharacterized protein n=1 Tax=Trichuris suis TaxID=68888 RepID=A0A085LU14_9BILA|nr:hypothetical protein M513_10678 [Trichuris suis]KFD62128.1 hypothetical protein M514_10678 [Trichuris suis]
MPGQAAAWNASECTFIAPLRVDVVHNDAFEAILTEIQQLHPPEPNTSHTSTMNGNETPGLDVCTMTHICCPIPEIELS